MADASTAAEATITERQNSDWSLQLLAAQRQLYSDAKRWRGLRAGSAACMAVVGVIATAIAPELLKAIGPAGTVLAIAQALAIAAEKRCTRVAATIQEQFDTSVYPLPWNAMLGSRIDAEEVTAAAVRHQGKRDDLLDWYSLPAGVPSPLDILLCQRTNLRWDMALRNAYAGTVAWALVSLFTLIMISGIARGLSLVDFLLALLPSASAFLLGVDTIRSHREHAATQLALKSQIEAVWGRALADGQAVDTAELRAIQDSIFRLRAGAPPVPDRFYWRKRGELEHGMRMAAQRLWEEAQMTTKPGA
jgi:hypothetical protein